MGINNIDGVTYRDKISFNANSSSLPTFIKYRGVIYSFPDVSDGLISISFKEGALPTTLVYDLYTKEFSKKLSCPKEDGFVSTNNISSEELSIFAEVVKRAVKYAEKTNNKQLVNQLKQYFKSNIFF